MTQLNTFVPTIINGYPVGGCKFSDEPSNEPKFGAMRELSDQNLPSSVDLRQLMTPVEHQASMSSCVGNALAGAYEFLIMKNHRVHVDVSRLFIYYNSRIIDGYEEGFMEDKGTFINHAIQGLKTYGCCKEKLFPYEKSNVLKKPPQESYNEAKNYRIASAMTIKTKVSEMKACLAEGYPFAFGLVVFPSITRAEYNGGRVSTPTSYEIAHVEPLGGHAMLAVGYSDESQCFIIRNSYGPGWGDKGYGYIHYNYMGNPQLCRDIHAIKEIHDESPRRTRERDQDRHRTIDNPFNWNTHKDKHFFIPDDYQFDFFDREFFWKPNDRFNYFHENHSNTDNNNFNCYVLWIDKYNSDSKNVSNQLMKGANVDIQFYERFEDGTNYLLKNRTQINANSQFSIICRGYYPDENKNPLDLIRFLIQNDFQGITVFVFTKDPNGVRHYIEQDASKSEMSECQDRLVFINNGNELIERIKRE